MTTPSTPSQPESSASGEPTSKIDMTKNLAAGAPVPFDPYRFGRPEHPVPPEYAPPGYTPPPAAVTPPSPYGAPPYENQGSQPYGSQPYGPPYSQSPYGQQPYAYGAPPPPARHEYAQPKAGNGKAIAALVLGIVSILLFWTTIFDAVPVILTVIFGILGITAAGDGRGGKGMAVAGLVCGVIGAVAAIVTTVIVTNAVNKCGGIDQNGAAGFQQCVRDNL